MRVRILRLIFSCAALSLVVSGAGMCSTKPGPSGKAPALCGECLDLPSGTVCTAEGTVRNSCVAICRQIKIECNHACPCEKK
ncbi:MAG: hypothetical protein HY042_13310 [Spirochaetia bacterium]|nr:hypothetical protein [Spirochaetia bacterium]